MAIRATPLRMSELTSMKSSLRAAFGRIGGDIISGVHERIAREAMSSHGGVPVQGGGVSAKKKTKKELEELEESAQFAHCLSLYGFDRAFDKFEAWKKNRKQ